jgi:hypothetical protein
MEATSNKALKTTVEETAPEALRSTNLSGNTKGVAKETPITNALPTHGFQNTHTAICSYLTYFTVRNLNYRADKNSVQIRMNNPGGDPCDFRGAATIAADSGITRLFKSTDSDIVITQKFPIQETVANGRANWTNWQAWAKMYQVYTTLKVYYKLTIHHPRSGSNNGALVITATESKTSGDGDENRTIRDGNVYMYLGLENHIKYSVGPGTNDGGNQGSYTVIEGTYYPGMFKRNAVNDSDVRTWNKVSEAPDLIDTLFVGFFADPLRPEMRKQHLNCSLEMKATVQFKDLKEAFRYPSSQDTAISLIAPQDLRHYFQAQPTFFNDGPV